jgi:hypothetical protein
MSAAAFAGGPLGSMMEPLMSGLMDPRLASDSYLPVESLGGPSPSDALSSIVQAHLQSIGSAPTPFSSEIGDFMAPLLGGGGMSFVNAGDQSSAEALNDTMQLNYVVAQRWPDASERALRPGVPIFAYHSDLRVTPPGWAVVASPVKVNEVQLKLAELERAVAFHGVAAQVDDPRRMRFRSQNSMHVHAGTPMLNVSAVDNEELSTHRYWGATTVQGLYEKLNYVGPVHGIHSRENGSNDAHWRLNNTRGETYITHAFGTRARVHNMFSTAPELGEQFYFSLGKYDRDDLLAIGYKTTPSPYDYYHSSGYGHYGYGGGTGKRGYGDISSSYVTTPERNAADGNSVVQLRGWASRTGQQWLSKTSPIDTMKPEIADRFYVEREQRAAVEWVDTEFDTQTGELRIKKTLDEGMQEAVANLPSIVLENYLESVYIYPVGHVKGYKNPDSTAAAIHNAHYDMAALVSQPLIEIFLAN